MAAVNSVIPQRLALRLVEMFGTPGTYRLDGPYPKGRAQEIVLEYAAVLRGLDLAKKAGVFRKEIARDQWVIHLQVR